jgi:hypothetical protein
MPPVVHLILIVLSLVCFGLSAWQVNQPAPSPSWQRLVSFGLTALVASMISW